MTNKTGLEEFQLNHFRLEYETSDWFFKSQWQTEAKSIWWLIYRICLALCFTLGVFASMLDGFGGGKWFIYFTNWGGCLCMFTCVFGAVLVGCYYFQTTLFVQSWILKIYWASHFTAVATALVISTIYWTILYPSYENPNPTDGYNLWEHLFNSILMLLDHMLVAFPTHLLHFVYPFAFAFTYIIFSVIYYFAGGTNYHGNPAIYSIGLDWSKPGRTCITLISCIVLLFVICAILFLFYRLRVAISDSIK